MAVLEVAVVDVEERQPRLEPIQLGVRIEDLLLVDPEPGLVDVGVEAFLEKVQFQERDQLRGRARAEHRELERDEPLRLEPAERADREQLFRVTKIVAQRSAQFFRCLDVSHAHFAKVRGRPFSNASFTLWATSSGFATCPASLAVSMICLGSALIMSVSVKPGKSVWTRMPLSLVSAASALARPSVAYF